MSGIEGIKIKKDTDRDRSREEDDPYGYYIASPTCSQFVPVTRVFLISLNLKIDNKFLNFVYITSPLFFSQNL